jgi:hypothetical protein
MIRRMQLHGGGLPMDSIVQPLPMTVSLLG